ncbi:DNA-binding IscR family transcriptional regulator [Mucilaginibacter gracilis]|uniref:DNA-binding IscR family transcriptional regulator n=1 Tax=Mucilaginibacter gracilis TaxID=423350 RepID=A0A495J296_9SPHI|nr:Rrf2 family transcriptional regulator [Mucilaginibacter gracilis]RKR82771.1 DNA-binding IscR family transcriptional regulator [Mucilaginibacter gracilis]
MNNSRFSISVHILTLLASAKGEVLTSDFIASSININPVLVRKELINLRKHNLVGSREGKNGGTFLNKPASDICLSDVYQALKQLPLLGKSKNTPNPACPVGRQIEKHLSNLYHDAECALVAQLKTTTLQQFVNQFE